LIIKLIDINRNKNQNYAEKEIVIAAKLNAKIKYVVYINVQADVFSYFVFLYLLNINPITQIGL
jgi:hypothetical protein